MENKKENTMERLAREINEVKEKQNKYGEKTLEEILFICERQGYILPYQEISFEAIYLHYEGNKRKEYSERLKNIQQGNWDEDCYGI